MSKPRATLTRADTGNLLVRFGGAAWVMHGRTRPTWEQVDLGFDSHAAYLDAALPAAIPRAIRAPMPRCAVRQANVGAAGLCARVSPSPGAPMRELDTGESSLPTLPGKDLLPDREAP